MVPSRLVSKTDLKKKFKAKYGYELGVPKNWSAYEDIANFSLMMLKLLMEKEFMAYGLWKKRPFSWMAFY